LHFFFLALFFDLGALLELLERKGFLSRTEALEAAGLSE
jgi:hypothetical protein